MGASGESPAEATISEKYLFAVHKDAIQVDPGRAEMRDDLSRD